MTHPAFILHDVSVWYGNQAAVRHVNLTVPAGGITALIGPSGCGKTTLLRALNRLTDTIVGARITGGISLFGRDILAPDIVLPDLRRRVGMLFQKPNPFPRSIFDNVAWGVRLHGLARGRSELQDRVRQSLHQAALWDEVGHRLHSPAMELSGGQQQRLCLARALAVEPEVLLLDEPCSALDPVAAERVEQLLLGLLPRVTQILVTHSLAQARRLAAQCAFLHLGEMVEVAPTAQLFLQPQDQRTRDYVIGRTG